MSGKHRRGRHRAPSRRWPWLLPLAALPALVPHPAPAPAAAATIEATRAVVLTQPAPQPPPRRVPPLVGEVGLRPNAEALARYLQATYPTVREIGGVRPCDQYREHCRGIALDVMVGDDRTLGDTIAADVLAHADTFGVRFVIWRETLQRPNGVRAWMADRGSVTANHFDHVHCAVAA